MTDKSIIIEDGPPSKRLRVELSEYEGYPLLNIREWYKQGESGELKPSRKGIALTRNNYLAVRSALVQSHDDIMQHLRITSDKNIGEADRIESKSSHGRRAQSIARVEWSVEAFRPVSQLYNVEFEGAVATVVFNPSHDFVRQVRGSDGDGGQLDALASFLVGLELARLQSLTEGLLDPSTLFELVSDRMQRALAQICRGTE